MAMEELEQWIRERLGWQLQLIQRDRRCTTIEWSLVRPAIEQHLTTPIVNLVIHFMEEKEEIISELEEENRRLLGSLNMLSFANNPERDQQILELHAQGLRPREIARQVRMSRHGVAKALKRLNGNSVALVQ